MNWSLYGDFNNPELGTEFFAADLKETRVSPHSAHCWIGISRAVREQATMPYIVETINKFIKKLELD
jgi:hypothetical protein